MGHSQPVVRRETVYLKDSKESKALRPRDLSRDLSAEPFVLTKLGLTNLPPLKFGFNKK